MREVQADREQVGCGSGTCISVQPWDTKGTAVVIRSDYFKTLHGNPEHDDDAAMLATKQEWQAFRRQIKSGDWDHIFPDGPPPAEILIVSTNQEELNDPTAVRLVNQEVRDRFSCGECYDIAHDEMDERDTCEQHEEVRDWFEIRRGTD